MRKIQLWKDKEVKIDLHIHSTYSDGVLSPEELVKLAVSINLNAIAITDHDNILGYKKASEYIKENNIPLEIIPGIEVNTLFKGEEVHILGYFMDMEDKAFKEMLKKQQAARIAQTKEIIKLINKQEGSNIKFEDVKKLTVENGSMGRPHIAKAVIASGLTGNLSETYAKFINDKSPTYTQRKTVSPHEAVETIYDAGGIPVIAHPCDIENPEKLIPDLMNYGLRGIEAYHRKHSPAMVEYFSSLAEKLGLIVTGGSDFHSPSLVNGQILLGKNFIPEKIYDELMKEKKRIEIAHS